jgi:hypothetical protein
VGREEPLISEYLTTALENLLPKVSNLTQNSSIHTPGPCDFPIAVVHKSNWWGWIRPTADVWLYAQIRTDANNNSVNMVVT